MSVGTSSGKGITFDTTGWTYSNMNHIITANCGFVGVKPLMIKGGGMFLCNYTPEKIANQAAFSGAVTVSDRAVLAVKPGKCPTKGAITVNSGATLAAKGAGVVDLSANNVKLNSGAKLGFEFERFSTAPQFKFTEDKLSFSASESTNVVVKISGKYPSSSAFTLTSGYNFRNVTSVISAEDNPKWVKSIYLDDNGNIVLQAKPRPTRIIVR